MFLNRLPVLGGLHAVPAVRRVAFDDRPVELFDEFADEFGTKMVRLHRFAGGNLDAELAFRLPFERFVNLHEGIGTDFREEVDGRIGVGVVMRERFERDLFAGNRREGVFGGKIDGGRGDRFRFGGRERVSNGVSA